MGSRASSQELISLGRYIREHRQKAGMSQEALAEKAGISPNTVSRIEGGLTASSVETFRKLAQALNLADGGLLRREVSQDWKNGDTVDIFSRVSRMEQREREIVMRTVKVLVDMLKKNR